MLGTISIVNVHDSKLRDAIYNQRGYAGYKVSGKYMGKSTLEQCAHTLDLMASEVLEGRNMLVDSWPQDRFTQLALQPLLTRFNVKFITDLVSHDQLAHEVGVHVAENNAMPKFCFQTADQSWIGDYNPEIILCGDVSNFKHGIGYPFMHSTHSSLVFNEQIGRIGVFRRYRIAIVNVNNPNGFWALDQLMQYGKTKIVIALGLQAEVTARRLKSAQENMVGVVNHPSFVYRFKRNRWNEWGDELETLIEASASRLPQKENNTITNDLS